MVFILNTMVGFACAVGTEFNHNHNESIKHHHHNEVSDKKGTHDDDDCCNKNVVKFSQLDKLLIQSVETGIQLPVTFVFLHTFYLSYSSPFAIVNQQFRVIRHYTPKTPDIRVSIRSFQI